MIQQNPEFSTKPKAVKGAAAFSKTIGVLQLIADAQQPQTISQLVELSGLPRPTLHRILKALVFEGMVQIRPNKTYIVGTRMITLAGRAIEQNEIMRISERHIEQLCNETQETIHLAIFTGKDLVYTQKKDSPHAVRIASTIGGSAPMHASAIGRCVLAFLPQEDRIGILDSLSLSRLTKYTIVDRASLENEIAKTRQNGYSVAHQQTDLEIECFGACVFDRRGMPVAGISISVPLYRRDQDIQKYVQPLRQCCSRISSQLST